MSARVVRVGDLGAAVTPLGPSGVVELDGRRLDARSDHAFIPSGAAVVVLRGDPTGYVVREVGPDRPVPHLPDAGAEIARPEFMRNSAEVRVAAARTAAEVRRVWAKASRQRVGVAAVVGAGAGLGDALLAHGTDPDALLAGAGLGLVTAAAVALLTGRAGYFLRWSPVAAVAAIGGGLLGAEAGYWVHVAAGVPLMLAIPAGALLGLVAGGWVGRNLTVLAGPGS